jgi:hypothetical protein
MRGSKSRGEYDLSPPSSAEVRMNRAIYSTATYAFMVCRGTNLVQLELNNLVQKFVKCFLKANQNFSSSEILEMYMLDSYMNAHTCSVKNMRYLQFICNVRTVF